MSVQPKPVCPRLSVLVIGFLVFAATFLAGCEVADLDAALRSPATQTVTAMQPGGSPSGTPGPTAEWRVYTNAKYGFGLKYPPGWQYLEVPTPAYPTETDGVWFVSDALPILGTDAAADLTLIMSGEEPLSRWHPRYFDDYSAEPSSLGQVPAVKISGRNKESGYQELVVIAKIGDVYIQALFNQCPASVSYGYQILSTFALTPSQE